MTLLANSAFAQTTEQKQKFMDSVNKYRSELGLRPYVYDFHADSLAQRRVETLIEYIDNIGVEVVDKNPRAYLHYGSDEDYIDYNEYLIESTLDTVSYNSECSAFLTDWWSNGPETLHWKLFNGWKRSKDHWNMMMDNDFQRLALSWKYYNGRVLACLVVFDHKPRYDHPE